MEIQHIAKPIFYDIEVAPNNFAICLKMDGKKTTLSSKQFTKFYNEKLQQWLYDKTHFLVGYNNKKYDDIIISNLLYRFTSFEDLYNLSNKLVNQQVKPWDCFTDSIIKKSTFDIINDLFPQGEGAVFKSLKEFQLELGWKFDLYEDFESNITKENLKEWLDYLNNDVDSTERLFNDFCKPSVNVYIQLCELFNQPKDKIYTRIMSQQKTVQYDFDLTNVLTPTKGVKCNFPPLKHFDQDVNNFFNMDWSSYTEISDKSVSFRLHDCMIKLAGGGLHGATNNTRFKSTKEKKVLLLDFDSWYPSQMLKLLLDNPHWNIIPNLDYEKLKSIVDRRIKAKHTGDKTTADALKLLINSIYGLLNFKGKHNPFYNPNFYVGVIMEGQYRMLQLLDLFIDKELKFDLIQANTDGIYIHVDVEDVDKVEPYLREWETMNNGHYHCDIVDVDSIYQLDVNNYVASIGGKIKAKGSKCLNNYEFKKKTKSDLSNIYAVNKLWVAHVLEQPVELQDEDYQVIVKSNKISNFDDLPKITNVYLTNDKLGKPLTFNGGKHKEVDGNYLYYTTDITKLDKSIYNELLESRLHKYANNLHYKGAHDKEENIQVKTKFHNYWDDKKVEVVPFKKDKIRFTNEMTSKLTSNQLITFKMCESLAIKPGHEYIVFDFDLNTQEDYDALPKWLKYIYNCDTTRSLNPINEFRRKLVFKYKSKESFKFSVNGVELMNANHTATLWGKYKKTPKGNKWLSYEYIECDTILDIGEGVLDKLILQNKPKKVINSSTSPLELLTPFQVKKYKIHENERGYIVGYCPNNENHNTFGQAPNECLYFVNGKGKIGTKCCHTNSGCWKPNFKILNKVG